MIAGLVLLTACGTADPEGATEVDPTAGATIALEDGALLEIPSGAVDQTLDVRFEEVDVDPELPVGLERVSAVYDFDAGGQRTFAKPVLLTLPYDAATTDLEEHDFYVVSWIDGSRVTMVRGTPDPESGTVTAGLSHNSWTFLIRVFKYVPFAKILSLATLPGVGGGDPNWRDHCARFTVTARPVEGLPGAWDVVAGPLVPGGDVQLWVFDGAGLNVGYEGLHAVESTSYETRVYLSEAAASGTFYAEVDHFLDGRCWTGSALFTVRPGTAPVEPPPEEIAISVFPRDGTDLRRTVDLTGFPAGSEVRLVMATPDRDIVWLGTFTIPADGAVTHVLELDANAAAGVYIVNVYDAHSGAHIGGPRFTLEVPPDGGVVEPPEPRAWVSPRFGSHLIRTLTVTDVTPGGRIEVEILNPEGLPETSFAGIASEAGVYTRAFRLRDSDPAGGYRARVTDTATGRQASASFGFAPPTTTTSTTTTTTTSGTTSSITTSSTTTSSTTTSSTTTSTTSTTSSTTQPGVSISVVASEPSTGTIWCDASDATPGGSVRFVVEDPNGSQVVNTTLSADGSGFKRLSYQPASPYPGGSWTCRVTDLSSGSSDSDSVMLAAG